jgi:hypothetical protein
MEDQAKKCLILKISALILANAGGGDALQDKEGIWAGRRENGGARGAAGDLI